MVDDATHREVSRMLENADHRYTGARRRLLDVLGAAGRPVNMPDVLAADDSLSQSSVYRNLDVLERCGVIHRLVTGGEYAYFELAEPLLGHHHHLICVGCGVVQDVELEDAVEDAIDEALDRAAQGVGFRPMRHTMDLHGHCADCER